MLEPIGGGGDTTTSSPATSVTSSAAWQTAVNDAQGTLMADFTNGSYNVVKYSSDHGAAVQTDIMGNQAGPQAEVTVDRYTNTVTVTQLDPATGKQTQYHETVTDYGPHNLSMSGNMPTGSDGSSLFPADQVAVFLAGPNGKGTTSSEPNAVYINDTASPFGSFGPEAQIATPSPSGSIQLDQLDLNSLPDLQSGSSVVNNMMTSEFMGATASNPQYYTAGVPQAQPPDIALHMISRSREIAE